jgi:hypothetical protein
MRYTSDILQFCKIEGVQFIGLGMYNYDVA